MRCRHLISTVLFSYSYWHKSAFLAPPTCKSRWSSYTYTDTVSDHSYPNYLLCRLKKIKFHVDYESAIVYYGLTVGNGTAGGTSPVAGKQTTDKHWNMSNNLMTAHNQWAIRPADQRYKTLTDLQQAVYSRRNLSTAVDMPVDKLHIKVEGDRLLLNDSIRPTEPTHWSFGQICGVSKAPASYLRTLSPELAAENLNYSLHRAPKAEFKLMTVKDPDGGINTLQAVTSKTYGRIWDADVVDAVARLVDRSGGKFHNPLAYTKGGGGAPEPSGLYASDHDIFMFMIDGGSFLEAGPRAQLNRGFIVWNSETGDKTLGIMTFLHNGVCGNHIIWGASNVQQLLIRHTSGAPNRFDREVIGVLNDYCNASTKPMEDAIRKAAAMPLNKVIDVADTKVLELGWKKAFARKHNFSVGEVTDAIAYANCEEGKCESLWDMVQGLTASAREYEFVDRRFDLEKRAGSLMQLVANN